jgi:hypothetical protein
LQPAWHFSPPILSVVKTRRFTSQTLPLARRPTGVIMHKFHSLRPLECLFFSLSDDDADKKMASLTTLPGSKSAANGP